MSPMRDGRTTSKDRATQLLICELLSFAMTITTMANTMTITTMANKMTITTMANKMTMTTMANKMTITTMANTMTTICFVQCCDLVDSRRCNSSPRLPGAGS